MSSLRGLGLGALTFTVALTLGPVATAATIKGSHLVFPVVVEPGPASTSDVPSQGYAVAQRIRSAAATRLQADHVVEYKPDRVIGFGGTRTVRFAASYLFIKAITREGDIYCAVGSDRADNWMTFFDIGLCLRDGDGDGVFESRTVVESVTRARTPYEIVLPESPVWTPVQISYDVADVGEIPAAEFRIGYTYTDPPLGRPQSFAELTICWPTALTLPADAHGQDELCSLLDWKASPSAYNDKELVKLKGQPGLAETVSWGPITASIVSRAAGLADISTADHQSTGPAIVELVGAWRMGTDFKNQTSVFDVRQGTSPAGADKAQSEDGGQQ